MPTALQVLVTFLGIIGVLSLWGFLVGISAKYCGKEKVNLVFCFFFPVFVAYSFGLKLKNTTPTQSSAQTNTNIELLSEISELRDKILSIEQILIDLLIDLPEVVKNIIQMERKQRKIATEKEKESNQKVTPEPEPKDLQD